MLAGNQASQCCCSQRRCQLSQKQSMHGNISVEPGGSGGLGRKKFTLHRGVVRIPQNPASISGFNNLRQLLTQEKTCRKAPSWMLRKQHQSWRVRSWAITPSSWSSPAKAIISSPLFFAPTLIVTEVARASESSSSSLVMSRDLSLATGLAPS